MQICLELNKTLCECTEVESIIHMLLFLPQKNKQKILGIGYKPYATDTYTHPLPLKFLALLPNGNNTIAINANE